MSGMKQFLILDIDGVLIESHGYRAACIDTINNFLEHFGQPYLKIDRSVTDKFESSGITAEWDMVPLALAAFADWYSDHIEITDTEKIFSEPLGSEILRDNQSFLKMLFEKISLFSDMLSPDVTPINAIYRFLTENNGSGMEHLWQQPFRDRFFLNTLDPWKSPFFAQLMNRLLGAKQFCEFYGMKAEIECESYLETKDRLLISEQYRELLPELAGKTIYPAVMTYRPTRYPNLAGNKNSLYFVNTPEGECAMHLLKWDNGRIPMIGAGSLCYIEEKYHLRREYYVKPHPFHALASIIISLCKDEITALETARLLCEYQPGPENSPLQNWIGINDKIELAVFEDSVTGIESIRNASDILRNWGYTVDLRLCGIHSTDAKDALLKKANAQIYSDINAALNVFDIQRLNNERSY